jgi:FkbM family methyltransferase
MNQNLRTVRLAFHSKDPLFYRHSNGFRFVVMRDVRETKMIYLSDAPYERVEAEIIRKWLVDGDLAVDCGANVGLMAGLMASAVGDEGRVLAVEASPITYDSLSRVIQALGLHQVQAINRCVSDGDGEVLFHHDDLHSESSAVVRGSQQRPVGSVVVRSASLQSLLRASATSPALIKIDVEGAEPDVLRGGRQFVRSGNPPLLIIEVYPTGLQRMGYSPIDIVDQLPFEYYEFWHVNFSWPNVAPEFPRGVPFPLSQPYAHIWPLHTNLIAIPKVGKFSQRRGKLAETLQRQ